MPNAEVCTRCLQPVPMSARRCPHCGEMHRSVRKQSLVLAIVMAVITGLVIYAITVLAKSQGAMPVAG